MDRPPFHVRPADLVARHMTQEQTEKRLKQALAAISLESMISGFQAYRETYKQVLQSPRRFAYQRLLPWQPGMLQSAISTLLYGIAISFLMYVPLNSKTRFGIREALFLAAIRLFSVATGLRRASLRKGFPRSWYFITNGYRLLHMVRYRVADWIDNLLSAFLLYTG